MELYSTYRKTVPLGRVPFLIKERSIWHPKFLSFHIKQDIMRLRTATMSCYACIDSEAEHCPYLLFIR